MIVRELVTYGTAGPAAVDETLRLLEPRKIGVRLRHPGHVAGGHGPASLDLLFEHAGRKRLPIDPALELGMLLLERSDQRHHGEEVVAADIQHQLRVGYVAMEIGEIVDFRNREREPALRGVVVLAVLPGGKMASGVARSAARAASGRRRAAASAEARAVLRI
jgi:hypothetical protein